MSGALLHYLDWATLNLAMLPLILLVLLATLWHWFSSVFRPVNRFSGTGD